MYKSMTPKLCVVKKYHTFIKLNAGYANFVCVGILPLLLCSLLRIEGNIKTGCEKALQLAFSNRQVADLLVYARKPSPKTYGFLDLLQPDYVRLYTRFFVLDVRENIAEGRLSGKDRKIAYNLGGSSKGAFPLYVY